MPQRLLLLAVLCLAGGAAAAEPPPPLTIPDLAGPRTLGLQAGIGLASGSEALFQNPAALAARRRYVADAFFLTDRRPGSGSRDARQQNYLGGVIADSSTTAVAAGLAYLQAMKGVEKGTLLRLGLATSVSQGLFLGVQGNYFDVHGAEKVRSTFNADAGAFFQVTPKVSIGGAAYNLLHTSHRAVMPRGYGAGFAFGSDTSLQIVGDWRLDLDRAQPRSGKKKTNRYSVGAEYLYGGAVPLRAGFEVDDTSKTKWWSAGAGYVTPRVALDLGFRQSTTEPRARTYGVALRVFVPAE